MPTLQPCTALDASSEALSDQASSFWVSHGPAPNLDKLLGTRDPPPDSSAADLRRASRNGDDRLVQELLRMLPHAEIDAADGDRRTALWWAAWGGHAGVAQLLMERGASLEIPGGVACLTPVRVSYVRGHRSLAKQFLRTADQRRSIRLQSARSVRGIGEPIGVAANASQYPQLAFRPATVGAWYWKDALALIHNDAR